MIMKTEYKTVRIHEDTYKTLKKMSKETDTPITIVLTKVVNERSEGIINDYEFKQRAKEHVSALDALLTKPMNY